MNGPSSGHASDSAAIREYPLLQVGPGRGAFYLGLHLYHQGLSRKAEAMWRLATDLDGDDVLSQFALGCCLMDGGHLEMAQQAFEHVLRLNPDDVAARLRLACVLRDRGDSESAMTELQYLASYAPEAVGLDQRAASCHDLAHRLAQLQRPSGLPREMALP